jgi:hypothetical protein
MKIVLTLSDYQLQLIKESLVYSSRNDKRLAKNDPSWKELKQMIQLAHDRLSDKATLHMDIAAYPE